MNERTAVLFLVLCVAALLGLIELEKVFEEEKISKKERKVAELKKQKEDREKAKAIDDKIFKVRIKHDGRPETNIATVILDAGGSYDPNKVDKLVFEWKQVAGKTVYLEPTPSSPRVAFNAGPGEYKFEITLTDGYGTIIKDVKTVHILEETNDLKSKISQIENDKVFLNLDVIDRQDIVDLSSKYRFSYQDLRQLSIIARDFYMWDEFGVKKCIENFEISQNRPLTKKDVISHVKGEWNSLKTSKIKYDTVDTKNLPRPVPRKIQVSEQDNEVFGMCPVASEKTVCCNLMTIDAVQGCSLGCSYCSIQTFYTDGKISIDKNLKEKLSNIPLDPNKNYHIGSGQSSDSLAVGNREGVLDAHKIKEYSPLVKNRYTG